jgi:hypothetical protein
VVLLAFLIGAAAGYGIASDGIGLSKGASLAIGWAAGLLLALIVWRWRSWRAGFRVENYREAAQTLRISDPDTYEKILANAHGTEAEDAAMRDPDAYVALFLAELHRSTQSDDPQAE